MTQEKQDPNLLLSNYWFDLPKDRIAQHPAEHREASRLMVLRRGTQEIGHHVFEDLPDLLRPGDLLVVNDTRVIPARLIAFRESTGGRVVLLLVRRIGAGEWSVMVRSRGRLNSPELLRIENTDVCVVLERKAEGAWTLRADPEELDKAIRTSGRAPLPPYIRRHYPQDEFRQEDLQRYQTVFARHPGSIAAPTAGLHLSEPLIDRLKACGIEMTSVTLHVGPGTFKPVRTERITDHKMEPERFFVSEEAADLINRARREGRRVVAVGTTVCRTLESVADGREVRPGRGETNLFIHPPYEFRTIDALITNFHLPGSTLLMLVSALAGREFILRAYKIAVESGYRFYSYGDAMFIDS